MACVDGYESSGVRWACARGIVTRPHSPVCETFEQAADNIRALLANTPVTPERLFVAPVSIAHATPADFARAAALAEELGAGTYTCAAETPAERTTWHQETKAKPIVALDRAGFQSRGRAGPKLLARPARPARGPRRRVVAAPSAGGPVNSWSIAGEARFTPECTPWRIAGEASAHT